MRIAQCRTLNTARKLKKKNVEIMNKNCSTWNMERNLKTVKNEKCTLNDLEMARNTKNCGK
jgi:hypothetical protein